MHVSLAALLPSLLLVSVLASRTGPAAPWTSVIRQTLLLLACSIALCLAILFAIGYDPLALAAGGHLLPFTGGPTFTAAYSFFSFSHVLDAANCLLLMAPGAVIILVGLRRKPSSPRSVASTDRMLLSAAGGFPLILAGLANFEIGAFRDWDVFTFAAIPLVLLAGKALIEAFDDAPSLAHAAILVCGISALSTAAWIGVNARPQLAAERFERNLERGSLSTHARGYGWETLGSIRLHDGGMATALKSLLAAVEANPGNPRYWNSAGCLMLKLGRPEEAVDFFRKGLAGTRPVALDADCLFNLGNAYHLLNRHSEAIAAYGNAIRKNASFALAYNNMASSFTELGEYENALQCYGSVLRINPGNPETQHHINLILSRMTNPEQAWNRIRKLLDLA